MRPALLLAGLLTLPGFLSSAIPAHAGYGVIAYDFAAGKWGGHLGASRDKPTKEEAIDTALSQCGDKACKIHIKLASGRCGAFAATRDNMGIGAASRRSLEAARRAALQNCTKSLAGQCFVRTSYCVK